MACPNYPWAVGLCDDMIDIKKRDTKGLENDPFAFSSSPRDPN